MPIVPVGGAASTRAAEAVLLEGWGVPVPLLLERVAIAAARRVREMLPAGGRVTVLVGPGHNGADGLALARILAQSGVPVTALGLGDGRGEVWRQQADWAGRAGVRFRDLAEDAPGMGAVVVDALLGFGATRAPGEAMARAIRAAVGGSAWRFSLDVPTGLDPETGVPFGDVVFEAHETLATGVVKPATVADPGLFATGGLGWVDLGLPPEALALLPGRIVSCPEPKTAVADVHKGRRGRVLVLGGGAGMAGAPALAALAAMRGGAGLVEVRVPEELVPVVAGLVPEALVRAWNLEELGPALGAADVVLAGPGTLPKDHVQATLQRIWQDFPGPMVMDGGALSAALPPAPAGRWRVMTPHPGEAARLLEVAPALIQQDRFGSASKLVASFQSLVVLKGARPIVQGPTSGFRVMGWGTPALATAGSGDVLAGLVAAALTYGPRSEEDALGAVAAAVARHQQLGRAAAEWARDREIVARDLLTCGSSGPAWWPATPGAESMWTRIS
ncbi:MAG: NAD(P)H-hydrate dehydratase [Candidatus Sericytochromatia bacterium]|nr:NAD(P)H-hydrate dehydratase [Candidatus Sericytochromatia bacterium]